MKVNIIYSRKNLSFLVKLDKILFLNFLIKPLESQKLLKNISLITYNYMLLMKLLRMNGLIKPLTNFKDF